MSETDKEFPISQIDTNSRSSIVDIVSVEEPLEIRVVTGPPEKRRSRCLAITMRTPGHDPELATGFLFTEGIIQDAKQIEKVEMCGSVEDGRKTPNTVVVELTSDTDIDFQNLQRHFYMTSSCGICGKASLEILDRAFQPVNGIESLARDTVLELPERLREHQQSFQRTGGIHAAGLFDLTGQVQTVREDVGRHNALDKLIGHQLNSGRLPAHDSLLVVSGRASFELLQKALSASIAVFVAVGAPSSLAIELAERFNITLMGFADSGRFNIYSHPWRLR